MGHNNLVAISAHNDFKGAWQSQVAAYSCMKHQRAYPLVLVHGEGDLEPEFSELARIGLLVAKAPNCSATSIFAHAGEVAVSLGFVGLAFLPSDVVWTKKVSWPEDLCRSKGAIFCPSGDVGVIAEAWHRFGLSGAGAGACNVVSTNQSPGSAPSAGLLRYSHDHPCWRPSLATSREDAQIAWSPMAAPANTIQGRIHAEVREASMFWERSHENS